MTRRVRFYTGGLRGTNGRTNLEDEPTTKVDSSDFLLSIRKAIIQRRGRYPESKE